MTANTSYAASPLLMPGDFQFCSSVARLASCPQYTAVKERAPNSSHCSMQHTNTPPRKLCKNRLLIQRDGTYSLYLNDCAKISLHRVMVYRYTEKSSEHDSISEDLQDACTHTPSTMHALIKKFPPCLLPPPSFSVFHKHSLPLSLSLFPRKGERCQVRGCPH